MKVKEIMARNMTWLPADATIKDAAEKMRDLNVGALPVRQGKDDGGLAGIVTDRDIVCRVVAKGGDPAKTKVSECMSKSVTSCNEEDDLSAAARLMETKQFHRLLVQDRNKKFVGILSLGDIATHAPHELSGEIIEAISKSRPVVTASR